MVSRPALLNTPPPALAVLPERVLFSIVRMPRLYIPPPLLAVFPEIVLSTTLVLVHLNSAPPESLVVLFEIVDFSIVRFPAFHTPLAALPETTLFLMLRLA